MEISEHTEADKLVIVLGGRLDGNTSPELEGLLCPRIESTDTVIVDMARLDYISSAGLRVLLKAAKISRTTEHLLVLAGLTPQVREVFDISGFTAIFTIHDSRDRAIEALR